MTKQLNVFTQPPESVFVSYDTIRLNDRPGDPPPMMCPAWFGFDLSVSEDITSCAMVFDLPDHRTGIRQHSFMPEDKLRRGNGKETKDWQHFIEKGWLTVVPGHYVRYEPMLLWMKEQRALYGCNKVGYDPYNAPELVKALTAESFQCVPVRQGPLTFNAPMKSLKEELLDGNVTWFGDEMFAWYLRNVRLREGFFRAEKENWYPVRRAGAHKNAARKIDGFMAMMNAYILRLEDRVITGDGWRDSAPIAFSL